MATKFDITPEKEGGLLNFALRQLFFHPTDITEVDLKGKTAIITGASSGVGFACAQKLLDLGISKLIVSVRDDAKGHATIAALSEGRNIEPTTIEFWQLDLLSYDSVQEFAQRVNQSLNRLGIVILNAGVMPIRQTISPNTGHDEEVQVNYISTALLIVLLLRVIKSKTFSEPSRITIVSSDAAAWTAFKEKHNIPLLRSLDKTDAWDPIDRHFVTKLLMQLFVTELVPHVSESLAVINMVTPGLTYDTHITRDSLVLFIGKVHKVLRRLVGHTSPVAAQLVVDAAVNHGKETHGQYLSEQRVKPMASLVYTEEGVRVRTQLWKETMEELAFANVEDIILALG